ncbi:MAG: glycosyltransferase family 4 protein [Candidatus Competibacteraceae bacterium]|nr:glycosyltransferase family 4 protein [Candidatus Competibacteraceae bacterium]
MYDYLLVQGGAERLTLTLAERFPTADLCVASRNRAAVPDTLLEGLNIIDLQANAKTVPWRIIKSLHVFSRNTCFLRDYDWVLYGGNYSVSAVHNHKAGRNIHYCHTIPRFCYDLREYYLDRYPFWQRPLLQTLMAHVKSHYVKAINKMDLIIANSENVQARIRRYLNKDSVVIHPPCDTDRFKWIGQQDYYLSTARLEPFKRVDSIIAAFKQMPDKHLVIASGGSELLRLQQLAVNADNIHFTGWIDEDQLYRLVGNAIATIYVPIDEDFGMSPVESMAAGKPVIGVAEGGLLESVINQETGLLFSDQSIIDALKLAVQTMTTRRALTMRTACEKRARLFSKDIFFNAIGQVLLNSP